MSASKKSSTKSSAKSLTKSSVKSLTTSSATSSSKLNVNRLLFLESDSYLIKNTNQKFHCSHGYVTDSQLSSKSGSALVSSTGVHGSIIDAQFIDEFLRLSRKAQIMIPKDIGWVVGATGLGKADVVVDAGSGSGGTACFLSRYAKRVYSYDVRVDHSEHAKKNAELLHCDNVIFSVLDICTQKIPVKDVFLVVLDLPQPWDALLSAKTCLKAGGFIVTYSPSITQTQKSVTSATALGLVHIKTVEIIEREWTIDEQRCRPAHGALGHTGFLSLFRLLKIDE